ncbi:MAG: GNAT family N-acetyltransferase [Desulfamplus sp.]|nr:GNAT family N-acetyltransferase [Desulfamplus sp.]
MKIFDGKYTLRPFRDKDESGVLNLWTTAFKSNMPPEIFRWKYLENPYEQAMMLCVTDEEEVVTFYGGIPYLFQYENKVVPAVHLMDIMSHPMHRQNRIFEKTAKQFMEFFCTSENLLLMYGFPGEFHYSIGERILNYRMVTSAVYLTLCLNDAERITQPDLVNNDFDLTDGSASSLDKLSVERVALIDKEASWFDSLWSKTKEDYPFSIVRDSKFLKWRFFNHPARQYIVLKFADSSDNSNIKTDLEAFVVLQINGSKISIVDMLMPNSSALFKKVISLIVKYLTHEGVKHEGIDHIETWLPEKHFLAQNALACGFKNQKEPIGIIPTVSLFEHSPSLEWIQSNLYYNMGDGDLL